MIDRYCCFNVIYTSNFVCNISFLQKKRLDIFLVSGGKLNLLVNKCTKSHLIHLNNLISDLNRPPRPNLLQNS